MIQVSELGHPRSCSARNQIASCIEDGEIAMWASLFAYWKSPPGLP